MGTVYKHIGSYITCTQTQTLNNYLYAIQLFVRGSNPRRATQLIAYPLRQPCRQQQFLEVL